MGLLFVIQAKEHAENHTVAPTCAVSAQVRCLAQFSPLGGHSFSIFVNAWTSTQGEQERPSWLNVPERDATDVLHPPSQDSHELQQEGRHAESEELRSRHA